MDGKNSSNSSMIIAADGNVGVHHISDSKSLPTHATWQKHSMPDLPFDFQFSYTETPNAPVLKYRETPFSPFGPSTIGRPWIGGRPHNPSKKKKIVFDSFKPPPKDMKGVKHVQDPGPYPEGQGPKVARSREEIMGDPLTKEEIVYLVEKCKREKRQLNLGRDGLTHNMLDSIHSHWKRRRVCRIKCKGVPTVDMENVKFHIEDKTGGKIIYQTGGVLYLFRGRNYNYKDRPQIPLMLWKPATPVYPNLIQPAPEGLTAEEAKKLRKLGMKVRPICKLGKNGVYLDLVNEVKAAFKVDDLVRVDCQGLKPSDYKRIGAKLKDLVPCVLLSFEKEHILMWKGKEYSTDSRSEAPALEGTTDGDNKNFKLSVLLENPSKVESHFNANISVSLAVDLNPCCEHPHHSNLSYEEAHDRSVKPLDLAQNIEETGEENMSTDEDNEGDNSNPNTHQIIGELTSSIQCSLMNTSDNDAESLTTPSLRSSFNQAGHCSPDELMPSENRPSSDSVHQHEDYEDEPMLIGCPSDTSVHQQDCGDEEFALSEVPSMSITHHGKDLKGKKILVSEKSSSNDVMQDLIKEYGILARNKTLDEKIINDELTWMVDVNSLWEHALESGMAIEQKDMDPDLIIRKADELAQLAPLAPSYTTKLMYKLQIKRNSYTQLKDEPQIYFGRVLYKNKKPKKVKHKYELPTVGAPPIGRLPVDELAKYLVKKQASEAQGSESLSVPLC
ncbi:hypothetical protein KP509_13G021700 [Ceratopteris richardii]|nr:hypothetical protein KP509_13G021700 [Ceratopteris richardii]